MDRLRIAINPNDFPGKSEQDIRQLVEDAEIVYVFGLDPIGKAVGEVMLLPVPVKTASNLASKLYNG